MVDLALACGLTISVGALTAALIRISQLKGTVTAQDRHIQALKERCRNLKAQLPVAGANPTALRMTIFYQREQIEELKRKLAKQKQLLNQKWTDAKPTGCQGEQSNG